ncbi:putative Acyltransferase [Trypanosoma vivax]|uniref:Putative acetyltransferase n=1 Tax=Trypanosoma vivax (strain Y486) TaxID=1055687 RepID=G0TVJ0_TRYVY|nr:putative acetyltransferase [Trypanosoma vivax]KAH8620555.1 putative Acyltransferase [Trypanosoma vivax]CCC47956.1 putative acetyltransferase [Trypanosoma vivax Y486]
MLALLRGIIFVSAVTLTSFASYFLIAIWPVLLTAVLQFLTRRKFAIFSHTVNKFYDVIQHMWITFVVLLMEGVFGLRFAYTLVASATTPYAPRFEDVFAPSRPGKFKLIILNHRCPLDWLVMFPFIIRCGGSHSLRIVLKKELSCVPVFGWSMRLFRYLFLSRKWVTDEEVMTRMVSHYVSRGGATILLFPEGTDLSERSIARSNAFARQNNLPQYRYVLNPRSKGIVALKNMIGPENIEEIVDVTMGYEDFVPGERPVERSVFSGRFPSKVHIVCTRHRFDGSSVSHQLHEQTYGACPDDQQLFAVSSDDDGFKNWLCDQFSKKELLLSHFYSNNPVRFDTSHVLSVMGKDCNVVTYDEDQYVADHPGSTKIGRLARGIGSWSSLIATSAFWILSFVVFVHLWGFWLFTWCVLIFLWCFWISYYRGGLDSFLTTQPCSAVEPCLMAKKSD